MKTLIKLALIALMRYWFVEHHPDDEHFYKLYDILSAIEYRLYKWNVLTYMEMYELEEGLLP